MPPASRKQCIHDHIQHTNNDIDRGQKCVYVLEDPTQLLTLLFVCVIFLFFSVQWTVLAIRQKEREKETERGQVTATAHQQPSIYTLRLLACHSISHSVDYTPWGSCRENQGRNPILCHILCQSRSFKFSVITTDAAGGETGGSHCGGGEGKEVTVEE